MRAQKCARGQRNQHTPRHFILSPLICLVCFRLACLLVFPFSTLVGLLFACSCLCLSLLCSMLVICVYLVCCCVLFTCVYVYCVVGCCLSCMFFYWLNHSLDLLTALKFFCTVPRSASRQLSRKTPETVATFAGKFLLDRGKLTFSGKIVELFNTFVNCRYSYFVCVCLYSVCWFILLFWVLFVFSL